MTVRQASQWLRHFQRRFKLLPDHQELALRWAELVEAHGIRGYRAHDVRLVAAMLTYGVTQLLTFNGNDFKGFPVNIIDLASL